MSFFARYLKALYERYNIPNHEKDKLLMKFVFASHIICLGLCVKYSGMVYKFEFSLTRLLSRLGSKISHLEIPVLGRSFCYNTLSFMFQINLAECEDSLESFPTLNSLFTRKLRPNVRKIDAEALVSPCDGKITSLGVVSEKMLSIKERDYWTTELLTGQVFNFYGYKDIMMKNKENQLYYVTIYLEFKDSHRFFVPCDWEVVFRRHIHGYLQGMFRWNLLRKSEVTSHNERVIYFGKWKFGALYYIAVASFNTGDIQVFSDNQLKTNVSKFKDYMNSSIEADINKSFRKGEEFGVFNSGSTIVLMFEAPKDLKWAVNIDDRVQVGNKLIVE